MQTAACFLLTLAASSARPAPVACLSIQEVRCRCPVCERLDELAENDAARAELEARFQAEIRRAGSARSTSPSTVLPDFQVDGTTTFTGEERAAISSTLGDLRGGSASGHMILIRDGPRPVAFFQWTDFVVDPMSLEQWMSFPAQATVAGAAFHLVVPADRRERAVRDLIRVSPAVYRVARGSPPPPDEELVARVWVQREAQPAAPTAPSEGGEDDPLGTRAVRRALSALAENLATVPFPEIYIVWAVDASASMSDDRRSLATEIERLLADLDRVGKTVHMGVVRFDRETAVLVPSRSPVDRVRAAIVEPGPAGSGDERPLAAVREALGLLPRNPVGKAVVLVTDEGGQEPARELERTVAEVRRAGARVLVLGREAVFAWNHAYEMDESLEYRVAVDAGPESPGIEGVQAGPLCCIPRAADYVWCIRRQTLRDPTGDLAVDQYMEEVRRAYRRYLQSGDPVGAHLGFDHEVPSGFGIYSLARLADETGGVYGFLRARSYGDDGLRGYEPELVSPEEWERRNAADPLRRVVAQVLGEFQRAGSMGLQSHVQGGTSSMLRDATRAQQQVERWVAVLRRAAPSAGTPRRWIAHRDLLVAQLLAFHVQLDEYRLAIDADRPPADAPNGYFLRGSVERRTSDEQRREAVEALAQVRREHPGTPWARTAELLNRRLRGFQFVIFRFRGGGGGAAPPDSGDR